jgi:ABC-2 type transport system ATP-binding protein
MITMKNVTKSYDHFMALKGLDLTIPQGRIFGLLGPNGAGKTTAIRILMDIIRPDSGEVRILDTAPGLGIQHKIGYLPEERGLYRKMKVLDHLVFFGELKRMKAADARKKAAEMMEKFDLKDWMNKKTETLSKGMQQKVQFIGTLLHDPEILILDEPFSGLDPINQEMMRDELIRLAQEGRTIVFSTHVLPQAEQFIHELALINHGQVVLTGSLEKIKEDFAENRLYIQTSRGTDKLGVGDVQVAAKGEGYSVTLGRSLHRSEYLKSVLDAGVDVELFRPDEPSLEEIFMKAVRHDA